MAAAKCETVATEATGDDEEYPLVVEYCGLCTMPPEVKARTCFSMVATDTCLPSFI